MDQSSKRLDRCFLTIQISEKHQEAGLRPAGAPRVLTGLPALRGVSCCLAVGLGLQRFRQRPVDVELRERILDLAQIRRRQLERVVWGPILPGRSSRARSQGDLYREAVA
jgi:hypothetical protein